MRRSILFCLIWLFAVISFPEPGHAQTDRRFEHPQEYAARLEQRRLVLEDVLPKNDVPLRNFIFNRSKTWLPGSTVRVAFRGGSSKRLVAIAAIAKEWTQHANLIFNFKEGQTFRRWAPSDKKYRADIRISFDCVGYFSAIGTDAVDPLVLKPQEETMCLEGFDKNLPSSWKATVLHEFGHALGFEHEHQRSGDGCEDQFRWYDDAGYDRTKTLNGRLKPDVNGRRPGLYSLLEGPPYNWSSDQIVANLKKLPDSSAYRKNPIFDPQSIMMYSFPAWMFENQSSRCFTGQNTTLSIKDKQGAVMAYPKNKAAIKSVVQDQIKAMERLVEVDGLEPAVAKTYRARLEVMKHHLRHLD